MEHRTRKLETSGNTYFVGLLWRSPSVASNEEACCDGELFVSPYPITGFSPGLDADGRCRDCVHMLQSYQRPRGKFVFGTMAAPDAGVVRHTVGTWKAA